MEDAYDAPGYTGIFHRVPKQLRPITEQDFIAELAAENKFKDLFFIIRTIDRDKNGFVTTVELDDILKEVYKGLDD